MAKKFDEFVNGLACLSAALEALGGRQPIAIEVDTATWQALIDTPEGKEVLRWENPTQGYRMDIAGTEVRPNSQPLSSPPVTPQI